MKKLLYCAAALAVAFFAGSCQQEKLEPVQESNAVTFTVEAPAALQTRAIADGLNVNELVYEVWLTETLGDLTQNAQKLYQAKTDMAVENGVNKATITLDLVNDQKFTVLFWAQVKNEANPAYNTAELNAVTYARNSYDANDESLAAFYAVAYVNDCQHVKKDGSATGSQVTLYRPFAQLNLGTLNTSTAYTVALVRSEVNVKNVNTVFNVATSVASVPEEMTFKMAAVPSDPATLAVNGASYEYAGMNYMFAGDNVTVEYDIVTSLNGGMEGTVNNIVDAVPLKENYRTNIIGNLLTSKVDYEIVVDAEFNTPDEIITEGVDYVTTDLELNAALKQDKRDIVIDLAQEEVTRATAPKTYNVDVDSWKKLAFGSEQTKSITINANGNTINFNLKDSDWSHVSLNNDDAVLTINDANITTSGYNTDHWKRVILHFASDVVLNNVTAANGLGFKKDAVLNDVEVSQVGDNYALWVWAQGQTVTLDGVSVDSEGRALKVADEDADGPEKVTINVTNSTFKSAKKAAILVTSKAGAVINWGRGNDITGVAADPANAVWVDEDRKNIEDVTVTGASVIIEGQVSSTPVVTNAEELKAAIAAANNDKQTVILLKAGTYTGAFDIDAKNVALIGEDGVVIDGLVHGLNFAHILLRNITLTNATPATSESACDNADNYCLGAYVTDFVIEDCVFNVNNTGAAAGKGAINIYANRSDYKTSEIDGVQYDLVIRNTTFNCNGERPIRGKTNSYIEGCTFNDQHRYAIQVQGNSGLATETVTFINNKIVNPCATSGEAFAAGVSISKSQLLEDAAFNIYGNTLESTTFENLKFVYDNHDNVKITTCTLNGKPIVAGQCWPVDDEANEVQDDATYLYDAATNTYTIDSPKGLKWVADVVNSTTPYTPTLFDDAIVKLAKDIDLNNEEWIPIGDDRSQRTEWHGVFDGQGYKVSNVKITKKTDRDDENKSSYGLFGNVKGTVKNLTVENVSISGAPKFIGALVGRLNDGLIENCHVKNASVECNNWTIGGVVGQWNNGKISGCSIEKSTITGYAGVGAIAGLALNTGERTLEDCSVNDCAIVANGSFGGNFDKMFGTVLGATYNGELVVNLNKCSVENTTVKGQPSKALYGYRAEGDVVKINGTVINDDTIVITTAEELVAATTINAGQTVVLMSDIDLSGVEFGGLSAFHPENNNTFDGLGHTVSNWTNESGASDMGFIRGWVGTIKNVTLKNVHLKTSGRSAILAGKVYSNIDNCHLVECTLEDSYLACGLIAGLYNSGNITNCSVDGCYVQSNGGTGGIVGVINESAGERKVENCVVKNTTVNNLGSYGESYSGGLVCGMFNAGATYHFNNCTLENNTKEGNYVGDLFYSAEGETVYVDGVQQ